MLNTKTTGDDGSFFQNRKTAIWLLVNKRAILGESLINESEIFLVQPYQR
jgi:hypothetical protein